MPHVPRMPHTRRWSWPAEPGATTTGLGGRTRCGGVGGRPGRPVRKLCVPRAACLAVVVEGCAGAPVSAAAPGVAEVGGRPPRRVGPQALSGACLAVVWPWPARRSRWPHPVWWNRTARCSGPGRVLGVRRSGRGARCQWVHVGIGGGTWRGGVRWQRSAGRAAGIRMRRREPQAAPGGGTPGRPGSAGRSSDAAVAESARTPDGLASQFVGQAVHRLGRARQVQDEQRDAEGVGAGAGLGGVAGQ